MSRYLRSSKVRRATELLPPNRFVPAGPIEWAVPSPVVPDFVTETNKVRGNVKKGLLYEEAFANHMLDRFGDYYVPGPWFQYKELGRDRPRWCQPDGLLFIPLQSRIIIVETKLRHNSDAWWQLKHLYLPVIAAMFPPKQWNYCVVEVTRWYDKETLFPEKVKLCSDVLVVEPGEFGVHIWIQR